MSPRKYIHTWTGRSRSLWGGACLLVCVNCLHLEKTINYNWRRTANMNGRTHLASAARWCCFVKLTLQTHVAGAMKCRHSQTHVPIEHVSNYRETLHSEKIRCSSQQLLSPILPSSRYTTGNTEWGWWYGMVIHQLSLSHIICTQISQDLYGSSKILCIHLCGIEFPLQHVPPSSLVALYISRL